MGTKSTTVLLVLPCTAPVNWKERKMAGPHAGADETPPRVVLWGTYDLGKPRTRLLRKSLMTSDFDVTDVHAAVWSRVEDKSGIHGTKAKAKFALFWVLSYPGLILRYIRAPKHDVVVVGYLGHLDVLVIWPFARLRGAVIVWDAFLSLYDTVVTDRKMVRPNGLFARLIYAWEWLACRAADRIVLDTDSHADFFRQSYGLAKNKLSSIFVGAEVSAFQPTAVAELPTPTAEHRILFYGQFIPLHGIDTIVAAARLTQKQPIRWVIVGQGQHAPRIDALITETPEINIERHMWIAYEDLRNEIARADVCLGIFGEGQKSARVIPNKVFQILAAGRPLVTRDGPAIRELLTGTEPAIKLVRAGNASDLADAVTALCEDATSPQPLHKDIVERFSEAVLAQEWQMLVREAARERS